VHISHTNYKTQRIFHLYLTERSVSLSNILHNVVLISHTHYRT